MRYILIVLSILLIVFKNNSDPNVRIGLYKSDKPGKVQFAYYYLFKGIQTYIVGSEIRINADSTFVYKTCGNIINGRWRVIKDSLYLDVTYNRWRNDSLNKYGYKGKWPGIPKRPIGFKIRKNTLEQVRISESNIKEINKLKYTIPQ